MSHFKTIINVDWKQRRNIICIKFIGWCLTVVFIQQGYFFSSCFGFFLSSHWSGLFGTIFFGTILRILLLFFTVWAIGLWISLYPFSFCRQTFVKMAFTVTWNRRRFTQLASFRLFRCNSRSLRLDLEFSIDNIFLFHLEVVRVLRLIFIELCSATLSHLIHRPIILT